MFQRVRIAVARTAATTFATRLLAASFVFPRAMPLVYRDAEFWLGEVSS
jgi:hypothetical protein